MVNSWQHDKISILDLINDLSMHTRNVVLEVKLATELKQSSTTGERHT